MTDILVSIFIGVGGIFAVAAGIGIIRLPDVYIRMHAATKVGTLSSGLVLAGVGIHFAEPAVVLRCVLIFLFLLLTAPIGAHMIGRAALSIGIEPWGIEKAAQKGATPPPSQD
ncbi:MAG: monovalent cation/H(+) antiporter subunit G [Pseudomonadota bacterium]